MGFGDDLFGDIGQDSAKNLKDVLHIIMEMVMFYKNGDVPINATIAIQRYINLMVISTRGEMIQIYNHS